jgi:hypothetical protein
MSALLRYSAGSLAVLLATAYIAVSAESGMGAFSAVVIEPESAVTTLVNRTNKSDRAVTVSRTGGATVQKKPATAARDPKILEGCDPAFSPLAASAKSNFANRCMA